MSSTIPLPNPESVHGIPNFRTEAWDNDFSGKYYFDLVSMLRANRKLYTFTQAADAVNEAEARIGLVRHDIDERPSDALQLARQESDKGITATYFAITNSEHYSIRDPQTAKLLGAIASTYGHELGLHYNPNKWRREHITNLPDLEGNIMEQAQQLEHVTGLPVCSISFHEPGTDHPTWMNGPIRLAGLVNAYAGIFMSPDESAMYATDSAGIWAYGEPTARSQKAITANARTIQILTHAERWDLSA